MTTMQKDRWATRLGLVLAMAGNAVGLGNFLRFPAQAAKNGGGAFLIPYFVSLLVVGLPLVWIEWTMGRYGGRYGHHTTPGCFDVMGKSSYWKYLGVFGLWSCLIIASYYLYIESWCMGYALYSLIGGFRETDPGEFYKSLIGERPHSIMAASLHGMILFFVCIAINISILSRGLSKGIELVAKVGMPLLILFASILAVRGLMIDPDTDPHAQVSPFVGLNYIWNPQFDSLWNPMIWLAAAGQIFFTLSVGMGSMHCYASYLRDKDDITLNGTTAAWTNEFCEVVLGGTILIPIAVAYLGLDAVQTQSGFGLGFIVFPTLFNHWGNFAPLAGFLWFGLLFFAAITSSLAMGQPIMAFLQDEFGMNRAQSAKIFALMLVVLAIPVAVLHSQSYFDEFDFWAGTFSLVVMAACEAVLFCWVFGMDAGWQEMHRGAELRIWSCFYPIMKYVTPGFLLVILAASILKPAAGWEAYVRLPPQAGYPPWEWAHDSVIGKLMHKDLPVSADATHEDIRFHNLLKLMRTSDRVVLVGVFLGFAGLVSAAWRKRHKDD